MQSSSSDSASRSAPQILQDPEFQRLARRKNSLSLLLTLVMMGFYFSFIALIAYRPDVLSARRGGGATLGIPCGIGLILLGWILTGIYVRWANSSYDAMVARLKNKIS